MPQVSIDGRRIEVPAGTTILNAARRLGIEIPALCCAEGHPPHTSCFVCVVRVKGMPSLLPACATAVFEGMTIESETQEVAEARRTALELLLSDHAGDCSAPCELTCPARMNIARMNHQIQQGDFHGALLTVMRDIALPGVLGYICPAPCEKGCRRRLQDQPVSICLLKRFVAEHNLTSPELYLPEVRPSTGKVVAVVGAGPAGLAAAFHLALYGHSVVVFEARSQPGGGLREAIEHTALPPSLLAAEIGRISRLGVAFRLSVTVGKAVSREDLKKEFAAILLATGHSGTGEAFGLGMSPTGIAVDKETYVTGDPSVFAAGGAVRPVKMAVRALAQGKQAAYAMDRFLRGLPPAPYPRPFTSRLGKPTEAELAAISAEGSPQSRCQREKSSPVGLTAEEARQEAARCLHCDCRKPTSCKLRRYAQKYGAQQQRFRGERRAFEQIRQDSGVVYEPGKCINCGLCVSVTRRRGEKLGLTFVGRGFSVRVGVPFNESLTKALTETASECVRLCPTGALAFLQGPLEPDREEDQYG